MTLYCLVGYDNSTTKMTTIVLPFGSPIPSNKRFMVPKHTRSVKIHSRTYFDNVDTLVAEINVPSSNVDCALDFRLDSNRKLSITRGSVEVFQMEHVY